MRGRNNNFTVYVWPSHITVKYIPYTREHNDRSFYLKLVAAMGRYIYRVYLFMG